MEATEPYFPVVLTRLYKMVLVLSMAIQNKVAKQHFSVAVLVFVPIKDDLFLLISIKLFICKTV